MLYSCFWKGRKPNIFYFHVFGSECFIHYTKDKLSKFDPKPDPSIFLGYSFVSKAYRVYNKMTQVEEETIHITFKEKKERCRSESSRPGRRNGESVID